MQEATREATRPIGLVVVRDGQTTQALIRLVPNGGGLKISSGDIYVLHHEAYKSPAEDVSYFSKFLCTFAVAKVWMPAAIRPTSGT